MWSGSGGCQTRRWGAGAGQGFRVTLLEALASNSSMASTLGSYSALTGDWRRIVQDLDTVSPRPPPPRPRAPAHARPPARPPSDT